MGFVHMRHDQPKVLFAREAKRVFNDAEIEPSLEPLSGEVLKYKSSKIGDDARSRWKLLGNNQSAFFEFRVFYPFARAYSSGSPCDVFDRIEMSRKREYRERINVVDSGCFTPMVISSTGWWLR